MAHSSLQLSASWMNPILSKCMRERLRTSQVITWGFLTLCLTIFLYACLYFLFVHQLGRGSQFAAERAVLWVFGIQGFIIMFMGTGSIAHGIATERDKKLLDFQRVTPLGPLSKILGYLIGLPIREYYMLAVTMPVLLFGVWQSKLSAVTMLHLYLVFISSMIMYHLIGMAIGMVAPRPRIVATGLQVAIGVLYALALIPDLFGFAIFRYLTMTPGLVRVLHDAGIVNSSDFIANPAFFKINLHPTVYTLLLQGFISLTCFIVVFRKWKDQLMHAIGKVYGIVTLIVVQFMMIGSIWPQLFDITRVFVIDDTLAIKRSDYSQTTIRIVIYLFIALPLTATLVYLTTPNQHGFLHGLRRARKLGKKRLPILQDRAGSLWSTLSLIIVSGLAYTFFLVLITQTDSLLLIAPSILMTGVLVLTLIFSILSLYAVVSSFSSVVVLMYVFGGWVIPLMICIVFSMIPEKALNISGIYIGSFSPVFASIVSAITIYMDPDLQIFDSVTSKHFKPAAFLGLSWQVLLTTILMPTLFMRRRRITNLVFSEDTQVNEVQDDRATPER